MFTILLILVPMTGVLTISFLLSYNISKINSKLIKIIGLTTSLINLVISLTIFLLFDYSNSQYQFVQEYYELSLFDIYLGLDGLSIYFVLLTTIITPIALLSN
jgi:NADH:ubiquinone oxidoreductase subunit 4 (subunit M)